jgi:hypothetical protein
MKIKTLFIISAVIATVYGIAFIIVPSQVCAIYDIEATPILSYMDQLFGAALLAIGIISWLSRNAEISASLKVIILGLLISNGIGFIVSLIGQLNNVLGSLGWLNVVIYLFLFVGFGYFQFSKSAAVKS